jgi:hypothetical protein
MIAGNSCRFPPAHFKKGAGADRDADVDGEVDVDVDAFVTFLDGERARFPGFPRVFCSFFVFRVELSA